MFFDFFPTRFYQHSYDPQPHNVIVRSSKLAENAYEYPGDITVFNNNAYNIIALKIVRDVEPKLTFLNQHY